MLPFGDEVVVNGVCILRVHFPSVSVENQVVGVNLWALNANAPPTTARIAIAVNITFALFIKNGAF
jgi:hypothetical protein